MHGKSPWKTESKREVLLFFMIAYNRPRLNIFWYKGNEIIIIICTYFILCSIKLNSGTDKDQNAPIQNIILNIDKGWGISLVW